MDSHGKQPDLGLVGGVFRFFVEALDMTLGDLLEGIALHCFEGKLPPFSDETLRKIGQLKQVYGLDLTAADSHQLTKSGDKS